MKICPACSLTADDTLNFCPACGRKLVKQKSRPPAFAKAVVGFGLSLYGMISAISALAPVLMVMAMLLWSWMIYASDGYFDPDLLLMEKAFEYFLLLIAIFMPAQSFPLTIIGRYLARKAQKAGNSSALAHSGEKLGLIGIILSAATVVLALVGAATLHFLYLL